MLRHSQAQSSLRAGDIMSMNKVPVEMGPTRDGITRCMTIYGFDPSGNRFETFTGGLQSYPDQAPIAWSWESCPPASTTLQHRRIIGRDSPVESVAGQVRLSSPG